MTFGRTQTSLRSDLSKLAPRRDELGLKILAPGTSPVVDLVAVHGLNGHRERTWTTSSNVNWLCDLLPSDIPQARILTYGYDVRTHGSANFSVQYLHDHAVDFFQQLCAFRKTTKTEARPIIFLAHSLGGILVKTALIHSNLNSNLRSIRLFTYGIAFFGTPHTGSYAASWGTWLLKIGTLFLKTNTSTIRHLRVNSEWLQMQISQFNGIGSELHLACFYETYKTPVAFGQKILIVPKQSATLPGFANSADIALTRNHNHLVRFSNRLEPDYMIVVSNIKMLIERSGAFGKRQNHMSSPDRLSSGGPSTTSPKLLLQLPFSLPVEQNPRFVGRSHLLATIHKKLFPKTFIESSQAKVLVLYGLGGIGKTQLSLKYATQHRNKFSAVLWIDGSSRRTAQLSFRTIAQRYLDAAKQSEYSDVLQKFVEVLPQSEKMQLSRQARPDDASLSKVTEAVVAFLDSSTSTHNLPWLMIMDNVDELDDYPVSQFIPKNTKGKIIITTRLTATTYLGDSLEVDEVTDDSAIEILLNSSPLRLQTFEDHICAKKIAGTLGCIPLALEQAAFYINEARLQLDEYLPLLQKYRFRLLRDTKLTNSRASIFATWEISFNRLQSFDKAASELLLLLTFFHHASTWEGLFLLPSVTQFSDGYAPMERPSSPEFSWLTLLCQDELKLKSAFGKIMSVSLAKRGKQPGTVYLHPLVHSWGRDFLDPLERRKKLIHAFITIGQALERIYRTPLNKEFWNTQPRLVPHADACMKLIKSDATNETFQEILQSDITKVALFYFGVFFLDLGRLKEAEDAFRSILGSKAPTSRKDLIPNTKRKLAEILYYTSTYKESESFLCEAEVALTDLVGPRHPDTLAAQTQLGTNNFRVYKYEKSKTILMKVIKNDTNELGIIGRHGREAASLLSLVYRQLGPPSKGLELIDKALNDATSDSEHLVGLLSVKYSRAIVLQELGRWKEAMDVFSEVYQGRQKFYGSDHPISLQTANALGRIHCFLGNYEESKRLLDIAWYGQDKLGFSSSNETTQLRTLFNIGVLHREMGRYSESFECLDQAYKSEVRLYGPHSFSVVDQQLELGILFHQQGNFNEAIKMLESVLSTQLKHYPEDFMIHIQTRTALVDSLVQLGQLQKASEILRPAVSSANERLQPSNPRRLALDVCSASIPSPYGSSLPDRIKQLDNAIALLLASVSGHHPIVIRAKALLAQLFLEIGESTKPRALLHEVVRDVRTALGPSNPKTFKLIEFLGSVSSDSVKS